MYQFTEEKTVIEKLKFEIDFGIHYFKIVEDDEIHIYKIEIVEKPKLPWNEVNSVKIFRGYKQVILSTKKEETELPYMVKCFLTGKKEGDIISRTTFKKELNLALKYFQ